MIIIIRGTSYHENLLEDFLENALFLTLLGRVLCIADDSIVPGPLIHWECGDWGRGAESEGGEEGGGGKRD